MAKSEEATVFLADGASLMMTVVRVHGGKVAHGHDGGHDDVEQAHDGEGAGHGGGGGHGVDPLEGAPGVGVEARREVVGVRTPFKYVQ